MPFIHHLADVGECKIEEGTRIWQFSVVLDGARIGRDCNLNAHTLVEGDVTLGDRVTVKSGVYLWDGIRVADDVFIGPNATFTNDRTPRSRQYPAEFAGVTIDRNASIGANATVLPGIVIGEYAMVGAGAVVTRDVPAHGVVYGNPATIKGHVCHCGQKLEEMHCPTCGAEYDMENDRLCRATDQ
ncbi:acyltransferase [Spiribacter vilamensis]|uniref:Acetyltransferase-like isoleucine patch superfamily enzyme n=1 Tax=Spiribacter vilamensis TaxID=531306 RepID=A0A4Q8D1C6_9GAMM|nr:acyltransferase [Spiribacter vilamensis]RZU99104.1 acetyltransferase-like isoleucine patch superfamily enzyme [Spiribacter vilamensis]TVO61898.1 N-acetyltransferase [Spiribacter vilamensis]